MLRLHPDAADYEGPKLEFKGFFFWVSGSIISRDQITGYDADAKDIEEWIKTEYGVDYIQKEPDENFSVDMLRMIDQRFQQPYPLPERITKTIKRKPVLKPADVSFLNGAVNDFEMNLGRWLDSLESELPRVMGLGPDKDSLGAIRRNIRELRWLIDFNHTRKVDELGRDLLDFNGRLHDYNGNVAMSGGFIVRDLRDQIRTLEISDDVRIALNEKLDGLSLMLKMTSDYLVRLLRLSKVVGNIGRGITFEEFRHSTVGPFLKNYGRFIELEEQYDPAALAGMKLPFGLCNIVSHVLNNALQQYLLVKKEKFKGKIRMDVQTTREGQKFSISIEDEAGGIPEAVLPHIFDRLFTTKAHGAGFGLYWAKRLLQLYGGEISAANQGEGEHKGAVFAIAIPFDWPEHARKMSAVTEELVGRIREILQAKKHPRAEDLAPLVAGEISELANSIAHYTQSMEFDAADDLGRYGSPPYINEARRKDSIDFSKMVFEMGVTEAEITEVLLAILAADRPGGLSAEMAKRLPPETVIVTGEGSGPETAEDRYLNLQVRSAANIALSAEGLTAERRHQYQQAVRQIKYAIHKLINSCGIVWMRWRDIEEREGLPQAEIEHLQKIFKARLPERQLQLVQRYTYSTGSYTGFEDDPLVVERFPGWAGVIQGLTEALAAVNEEGRRKLRNYFQSRPLEEIETVKIWLHYMEYLIESAQTLASMSRGEVAQNRYWVDLENFPNNAEPLSKLLDRIHVEIQPGTRIWLNRFILGNIALNVYRMKDDRSMDITVDEADGSTRIRFRYKGNVNLQRVTETIGNDHPLYYVQFLLDLVETAGASVSAANDGEYAEITVLFPIPSSVTQTTTEITPLNNALSTARSEAPVGRDSAIVAPSASAVSVAAGERRTEMRSDLTQANLPEFARQAEDGQYTAFQATVLGRGESTLRIKCGEILGIVPREEVESGYSSFVSGRQISAVLLGSSQGAAIFSLFPTESLTARFNFLADLQHDLQQPLTARAINMRVLPDSFVIWNGRVSGMAVNYVEENQEGAAGFRIPGFIPYSAISYRFDETDRESLLHQPEVLDRLVADLRRRPFWAKLTNIDKKMGLQRLGLSRKAMEFSSLEEARGLYEILNFDVKALAFEPGSQAPVGLEGVLQSDLKPELNGLKAVLFVNSLEPSLRPQFRNDPAAFVSGAGTLAVRVNRVDLPHGQLSIQVTQKHMDPSNNIPMALRALRRAMVSRPQTPISVVVTTDTSSGQPFVPVQFNRVPGKLTVPEGHGQSLYTRSQTLRVYVSKVSTNSFEATLMPQSFMESDHRVETRNAKFIPAFVKVEGNYQRVRLDDGSMLSFYQAPLHSPSEKGGQMLRGFLDAITQSQLPPGDYVLYGDRQGPLLLTKMAVIPHDEIATSLQNPVIGQMLQQAGIQGDDFNLVRLLEIVPVIKTPPERAQTALDLWMKGIPALYGMDKTSPLVTVMGMSMKRPPCLTGLEIFQFPGNADFDHEVRLFYDLNVDGASEEDVAVFETEQRPNVRVVMFGKNRLYDRYEDYLTMLQPVAYETENILRVQDVQKTKELVAAGTPPHLILLPSQMSPQEAAEFYDFYHDLAGPLRPVIMLGWNPRILNRPSEHPFVQYLLSRDANYAAYEEVFDYSPYFTTNALIHFKRERKNIEQLLATRFPEFARTEMRESQNLGSHRNEARVTDTDGIIVELRKAMASPDDTLQKLIVLGRELEARTGLLAGDALIQVIFEGSRISLPLRLPEVLRFICDFLGSDEPVIESFNRHGVIAFVWLAMNVETGMEFGGLKGVAEGEKWLRDAFDLEAAARLLKSDPVRFADFLGILSTDSAERARSRYPDIVRPSLAGEQTVEQRIEHLVQSASRRSQIFLEKTQSGSPDENEKPWIGKIASLEAEELRGVIRWMAGDRTAVDYLQRLEISYSGFPLNFLAAMTIAVQWAPDSIEWENYCAISRLSPLDLYRGFSFLQVLLDQGIAKDRHSSSVMGRLFRKFKERQEMREKKHIWGPDRISNDSLPILNQNGNSMIPRAENRRNQISSERIRRAFSDDAYDDLSLIGHRLDVAFGSEEVRGYSTAEIEQIQNEMGPLIGNGTIGIPQLMLLYENRHIRLSTYRNLLLEVVWTAFSTALERAAATGDWDEFQTLCARFITSGPTARDVLMELERMLVDYRYGNGTVIAIDATTRRAQLDPWWRHIANFPGEAESVLATLRTPHFQSLFQNPKQGIWYSQIHRFIHRLWNHRPDTSEATVQEINQMTRERIGMVAGENDDEDENPGGVSEGYLQAMLMARQIAAALFDLVDALTQPSQEEPDLPGRLAANEVRISHDMIYNLLQAHHPDDGLPADSSDVLSDLSYYMLLQGLIVSGLRHHDINFLMRLIEAGSENVHLLILESIAARYSRSALMQEAPSMGAAIHDLLNYDESYSLILRKLQNFYPESDWSHPIDDNIIERLSRPEMRASHLTTQATAEARRVVVARKHPVSAFKKIGGRQELRLASYDAIRSVIGGPRSRAAKEAVARTIVRRGASGMASDLRVLSRRIQVAQQRVIDLQADQHLRAISHIETPTVVEYQISDAEWEELEKNRRVLKELMKTVRDAAASNKFVISRFNVSQQIVPKLAQIFKSLDHHKSQQIDYRPFDEAFVVFNAGLPDEGALENAAAVTVTSNKLASIQGVALASDGYMQGIGRPSGARLYTAALILAAEALSWKTIDSLAQYETGKFRPWSEEALNRLTVAVQGMLDRQRAELRLAQAA
jgi:signal transduction histidine kinase